MDSNSCEKIEIYADDSEDVIRIQSNRHVQASVLTALQTDDELCDVSLFGVPPSGVPRSALRPIRAQKSVVASMSTHLYELFASKTYKDSNQPYCEIEIVDHHILRIIVDFIHTDKLVINKQNADDVMRKLLIGAKYLLMKKLADACEKFLASNSHMTSENCISLWCFARKYKFWSLMDATSAFIAKNLSDMPKNEQFLSMTFADCSALFQNEAVEAGNVDARCVAVVAWLDHGDSRSSHVHDMLKTVKLSPGSVLIDTALAAHESHMLRKHVPTLAAELMAGVLYRIRQHRPVVDRFPQWYVIGGENAPNLFLTYDFKTRLWSKLPPLSLELQYASACAVNSRIVVMGGSRGNGGHATDIDEYDTKKKLWSYKRASLGQVRRYPAACCDGQYAYAIGGYKHGNVSETVERYDPESKEVIYVANMKSERVSSAAVFASKNKSIYVAGGSSNFELLSSIEKYDVEANKWTPAGNMKNKRYNSGAVLSEDDIYIVGGQTSNDISNCVEIFNINTGQRRSAPNLLENRSVCVATTSDNERVICALGGNSRTVECFDVREGKWSRGIVVRDLPEKASDFAFAVLS